MNMVQAHQDSSEEGTTKPIPILIVVGDQAYHCCVIDKLNDGVGVLPGRAGMSEQGVQEGAEHAPEGPLC